MTTSVRPARPFPISDIGFVLLGRKLDAESVPGARVTRHRQILVIRGPTPRRKSHGRPTRLADGRDRGANMTNSTTTQRAERSEQPIAKDASAGRGLLGREDLLQLLDRAVSRRVTVVSAPPGSGKTSLLRAWAGRSANPRRVAFVSVDRDEAHAQRLWRAVLESIRSPAAPIDRETEPGATVALDADQVLDRVVSEIAEQVEPVVLIIDDLHEL